MISSAHWLHASSWGSIHMVQFHRISIGTSRSASFLHFHDVLCTVRSRIRRAKKRGHSTFSINVECPLFSSLGEVQLFPRPMGEGQGEGTQSNTYALRLMPYASLRDLFILLFPPIVIFVVVSSKTGFSEHMRYVLPSFPFFYIAVSGVGRIFGNLKEGVLISPLEGVHCGLSRPSWRFRFVPLFSVPLVGVLASWLVASSLWIYPHSLSYFNEAIGGALNGPDYLRGSNVDWGQDIRYWYRKQFKMLENASLISFGSFFPPDTYPTLIPSRNHCNQSRTQLTASVNAFNNPFMQNMYYVVCSAELKRKLEKSVLRNEIVPCTYAMRTIELRD